MSIMLAAVAGTLLVAEPAAAQIDLHETFYGVPSRQAVRSRAGTAMRDAGRPAGADEPMRFEHPETVRQMAGGSPSARVRRTSARRAPGSTWSDSSANEAPLTTAEQIPTPAAIRHGGGVPCPECEGGAPHWGEPAVTFDGCGASGDCGYGMVESCDVCGPAYGCGAAGFRGGRRPINWWPMKDFSLVGGVHGFTGPVDDAAGTRADGPRDGRFGFNEGLNFGAPLGAYEGLGYQLGVLAVQSSFSDAFAGTHDQVFFTGGVFRRRPVGVQWGVVFDLMHRSFEDSDDADVKQIRSEASWLFPSGHELGYFGAYGVGSHLFSFEDRNIDGYLDPTDMFAVFWRKHFDNGSEGRIWAGASGRGDGLIGAELEMVLTRGISVQNRFTYLIPKHTADNGFAEESWGVTFQLVWHLGQPARCALQSPYRPMMNVADNTQFLTDFIETGTTGN